MEKSHQSECCHGQLKFNEMEEKGGKEMLTSQWQCPLDVLQFFAATFTFRIIFLGDDMYTSGSRINSNIESDENVHVILKLRWTQIQDNTEHFNIFYLIIVLPSDTDSSENLMLINTKFQHAPLQKASSTSLTTSRIAEDSWSYFLYLQSLPKQIISLLYDHMYAYRWAANLVASKFHLVEDSIFYLKDYRKKWMEAYAHKRADGITPSSEQVISRKRHQNDYGCRPSNMLILLVMLLYCMLPTSAAQCPHDVCPKVEACQKYLSDIYRCNETHPFTCGVDQHGTVRMFCHKRHECTMSGTANYVIHSDGHNQLRCMECPDGYMHLGQSSSPETIGCYIRHQYATGKDWTHVILLRNGTSTSQPVYYCDVKKGYVNSLGEMYCSPYDKCNCASLKDNPGWRCPDGKDIFPDRSCVDPCPQGSYRDPAKNFTCSGNRPSTKLNTTPSQTSLSSTISPEEVTKTGAGGEGGSNSHTVVIIIVVCVAFGVIVVVAVAVVRGIVVRKKCRHVTVNNTNNSTTNVMNIRRADAINLNASEPLMNGDLAEDHEATPMSREPELNGSVSHNGHAESIV